MSSTQLHFNDPSPFLLNPPSQFQIYGPDGSTLVDPVDPGVEAILYADISLDKIDEVKLIADNQVRSFSLRPLLSS